MRDLLDCRDAIDAIDSEIISLLQQRQEVARDVAQISPQPRDRR